MTPPADQGPSLPPSLSPDRLRRLLDGAVQAVHPPPGSYDRIQQGVRRRRSVQRFGAALLAVATLAGGSAAVLVAAAASAPARLAAVPSSPVASAPDTSTAYLGSAVPAVIRPFGNRKTSSRFLLTARTSGSGTQSVPFTVTPAPGLPAAAPVVVGSVDAAGDGTTEIFVLVNEGCCQQVWTIFRLDNGHLAQVTIAGKPAELAVGTVSGNGGFSCESTAHELLAYKPRTTGRAGRLLVTYRWSGASLVLVSQQHVLPHVPQHELVLTQYTGVWCGGLPQYAA